MTYSCEAQLERDGTTLHYDVTGSGRPLVLLHAGIADRRMWDPQRSALCDQYRVIRYDMRGFGNTRLSSGPFAHHRDLVALLDELKAEQATLVGASMGGAVALNAALARPERVEALVLVDAAIHGYNDWSEEFRAFGRAEDDALDRGDLDAAVELNVRMWLDRPGRSPVSAEAVSLVRTMQRRAFELQLAEPRAEEETLEPMADERLHEVNVPTLVVTGEDDAPDFQKIAERLAHAIPHTRTGVIQGAAHLPSLEQPDAFNRMLVDFLED